MDSAFLGHPAVTFFCCAIVIANKIVFFKQKLEVFHLSFSHKYHKAQDES